MRFFRGILQYLINKTQLLLHIDLLAWNLISNMDNINHIEIIGLWNYTIFCAIWVCIAKYSRVQQYESSIADFAMIKSYIE